MGTSVQIGAGSGVFLEAGAKLSIGIPLIGEIGVVVALKSSLDVKALLAAGYEEKFCFKLSLDLELRPLTLKLGLYERHILIKFRCLIKGRRFMS
jgi:hypothetical protein